MTVLEPPPPSWVRPIALGAAFTVMMEMLPLVVSAVVPVAAALMPCCCALEVLPIGFLPAFLAFRQDPRLTAGQGFTVAFIASGLGSVVVALVMSLQSRSVSIDELRTGMRESLEQLQRESGGTMTAEEMDAMAEQLANAVPYLPVVAACVVTVLAGVVGLITVSMMRRSLRGPPAAVSPAAPPPPPVG